MHTFNDGAKILSVELKDGKLEVVKKYPSNACYGTGAPVPDKVQKEVYAAVDGEIILERTIIGLHKPAYTVREEIIFPE